MGGGQGISVQYRALAFRDSGSGVGGLKESLEWFGDWQAFFAETKDSEAQAK